MDMDLLPERTARIAAPARLAVASGDIPGVVCLVWQGGKLLPVYPAGIAQAQPINVKPNWGG